MTYMLRRYLTIIFLFTTYFSFGQVDFDTIVDYDGFFDKLTMDEVLVTGAFSNLKRGESNLSIATLDYNNPKYVTKTLSQLLENIPGIFVDGSIGEELCRSGSGTNPTNPIRCADHHSRL